MSLGIRCRWGIRNGLFYVAKDSESHRVLGVAMWLPPKSSASPETRTEWIDSWSMWIQQLGMNIWYGRGGLNVKVSKLKCKIICCLVSLAWPWINGQNLPDCIFNFLLLFYGQLMVWTLIYLLGLCLDDFPFDKWGSRLTLPSSISSMANSALPLLSSTVLHLFGNALFLYRNVLL